MPFSISHFLIFCFIVCYLLLAWCWNLPDDSSAKIFIKQFRKFVVWLGLWHSWSMFAPNPISVDRRFMIELYDSAGTRHDLDLPAFANLGAWEGFKKARERKFQMNLASKKFQSYRIAICHYYIRNFEEENGAKLVKANLIMFTKKIAGPESEQEFAEKPTILCTLEK